MIFPGRILSLCTLFAWGGGVLTGAEKEISPESLQFFEKKIRPVLVDQCYSCHSAEAKKIKAGLRLDTRELLLKGGESGPAIVPGDPEKSLLIRAIRYADKEFQMPPKDKLPPAQIADFVTWVGMGAPDPRSTLSPAPTNQAPELNFAEARKFWAFQPVRKVEPPTVKNPRWISTTIDRFVLAGLEAKGLSPAPRVDKRTLIRRATFDLTGLPPSSEQIEEFQRDNSPTAYPRLVERLLNSPEYGERWGRHWLDVARYTDSNGLDENLAYANAFRYRDYVTRAFNSDKPYDQFIREQIAGDLLVKPDEDEASRREKWTATGFLSLGPKMLAEDDPLKMEMDIIDEQVDTVGKAVLGLTVGCARCHDHKFDPIPTADYYSLAAIFKSTKTMENFKVVAVWHEYVLATPEQVRNKEAHEERLKENEKATKDATTAALDEFLETERGKAGHYLLAAAGQVFKLTTNSVPRSTLNEEILAQWVSAVREGTNQIWEPWRSTNATSQELAALAARYAESFEKAQAAWKELKASKNTEKPTKLTDAALEPFRKILYDAKGPARAPSKPERFYSADAKEKLKDLATAKKNLEKDRPEFPSAMGVREGTAANLKIHLRGNYLTQGEEVPRRFPRVLAGEQQAAFPPEQSGRLQLARWLTEPTHPLTARVMANRIWLWHFGSGLVRSPDNFGRLGERPVNPELLDWLAGEFTRQGWSIKAMHRLIMLSSTYQLSTAASPALIEADPENKLYGHANRRRLDAEEVRDAILAVSGRLDRKMEGQLMTFKNRDYVTGTGSRTNNFDVNRRSLYLPVLRSAVFEVLQAFDFPDPSVLNGERAATTVTPQALFMMNGELVARNGASLANDLLAETDRDERTRIREAYGRVLGREPTRNELKRIQQFLKETENALLQEKAPAPEARQKAWRSFARVLIASNEFMYVE